MVDDIDIDEFRADPLGWTMKVIKHSFGEFSMAAVQANEDMEDFSQVEIDKEALFVGIYDGENGVIASEFLSQSLLPALLCESLLRSFAILVVSFMFACFYVFYLIFFC